MNLERTGMMEKYGETYKELSFKKKIAHLWEYYRWYAFSSIFGIIVVGSIVVTVLTPQRTYAVDVIIAGGIISDETQPEVVEKFADQLDTSLNISAVDFENMGELEMVMMQKIPLLLKTDELDVLVLSKAAFMSYLNQGGSGMFMPLNTIEEMKPLLEANKDNLITFKDLEISDEVELTEEEAEILKNEDNIYGIRVTALPSVTSMEIVEELVIGVTSRVKDVPKTVEVIEYLIK